jgi:biotin transport system substrate-specific component
MTNKGNGSRLQRLTLTALFAALLCVLSPISIPLGPIPLSLGLCGALLTALTLPPAMTLTAVAVYLGLGACGLPIFAAGGAGVAALISPTGGFLWSYLLAAPLVSALATRAKRLGGLLLAGLCALPICYVCGTAWYALMTNTPPLAALSVTVLPFVLFDLCKLALAASIAYRLRSILKLGQ